MIALHTSGNAHQNRSLPLLLSFLAIGLVSSALFFVRLGSDALEKWDESIHAQVTHEMLESGDWVDLTYRREPYFRKPPLRFWLQGVVSSVFGENEWTIRFWSAAAGVGTTLLIAAWAWQLRRNLAFVWLSALAFLSGKYIFYHAFRTGETDGLLTFFTLLALFAYWKSWARPRWLFLVAGALALALLTKSSAVVFAGGTILVHVLLTRRLFRYRWKLLLGCVGLFLVIAAPWFAVEAIHHGGRFWQEYVGVDVLERAGENLYQSGVGPGWYWDVFLKRFFPLAVFAIPALIWLVWRLYRRRDQTDLLWLIFLVVTAAVLSAVASKTNWYLLPLYPVFGLVIGQFLVDAWKERSWFASALLAWAAGVFVFRLPSMTAADSDFRWLVPQTYLGGRLGGVAGRLGLAIGIAILVLVVTWVVTRKPKLLWLWSAGFVALLLWLFVWGFGTQIAQLRVRIGFPVFRETRVFLSERRPERFYVANLLLAHEPAFVYYLERHPDVPLTNLGFDLEAARALPTGSYLFWKDEKGSVRPTGEILRQQPPYFLIRTGQP